MELTRPMVLVVKVVQALVGVAAGFISPTADGHLTMGGSLGKLACVSTSMFYSI